MTRGKREQGGGGGVRLVHKDTSNISLVASASYAQMLNQKRNQSILISGESGSGKTESQV